jgi:amino-acid N-acetyltransferase
MIAAQEVRSTIEQQLSRTFMSKGQIRGTAKMKVSSGNFVMAQPKGLQNGEDFEYTGIVRSIDKDVIMDNLKRGDIVLLSHMAHSHQGLTYSCDSISLAETCAARLGAEKLIFLHEGEHLENVETGERIDLPLRSAVDLVTHMKTISPPETGTDVLQTYMKSAVNACRSGVRRTHLVNRHVDGALLVELFSRDGHGLLISRDVYEGVRIVRVCHNQSLTLTDRSKKHRYVKRFPKT